MPHQVDRGHDDTSEQAAFRAEARAWLRANAKPKQEGGALAVPFGWEDEAAMVRAAKAWQATLYDAHWAGITWPKEFGGRGGSVVEQIIFGEEAAAFETPNAGVFTIGIGMVGPTIMRHGSAAQRERYLRPLLRGDEIWCQLFSEPGAGSDLAGLTTRAVREGNGWVVNGQKVWTSGAHYRDFGLLLARTSTELARNKGISCFIVDMRATGVDVRPLRQMTGGSSFNEVFLTELVLREDSLIGEEHHGWQVAVTTLANERVALGGGGGSLFSHLVTLARRRRRDQDPLIRQHLSDIYIRTEIVRYLGMRTRSEVFRGTVPGPQGSVAKLAASLIAQDVGDLALALEGPAGALAGPEAPNAGAWQLQRLGAPALRIAGGTDEIQRNILGERVLGLPREPRPTES
jgi:alkylation response protein AidB-like acyl-CoA dehydrogenase